MKQSQQNVKHVLLGFRVQMLMKLLWNVRMDTIVWDQHHNVYYALMDTGIYKQIDSVKVKNKVKMHVYACLMFEFSSSFKRA